MKRLAIATALFACGFSAHSTTLTGFQTFGDGMDGMKVTVTFDDLTSDSAVWADTGPGAGAASGIGWVLAETGDSFNDGAWTATNSSGKSIVKMVIEAIPGNTVFDMIPDPVLTPGSARGKPFTVISGSAPVSAYSAPIDISLGDLFGTLTLSWEPGSALRDGASLNFSQDTDSGTADDPVRQVPAPGALALLGIGLVGVGFLRRRPAR